MHRRQISIVAPDLQHVAEIDREGSGHGLDHHEAFVLLHLQSGDVVALDDAIAIEVLDALDLIAEAVIVAIGVEVVEEAVAVVIDRRSPRGLERRREGVAIIVGIAISQRCASFRTRTG